MQELSPLIEQSEVHIAEAQVLEEIGILGILAVELLQVDASLVELAGGEELEARERWSVIANAKGAVKLKWLPRWFVLAKPFIVFLVFIIRLCKEGQSGIAYC